MNDTSTTMKTILVILVAGLLAAAPLRAQDDSNTSPVVYSSTVVYQAGVVYTAPVVYQAPVYYVSPSTPQSACPAPACSAVCYPQPASTITYIGGGQTHTAVYYPSCNSGTQVIYFGHGQAASQGYQFSNRR
jgi:hypothetical protein